MIVFCIGAVYCCFLLRKLTLLMAWQEIEVILLYFSVALLPVGWIFVMANHSYIHYWFTYKEFSISSFALLSLGVYLRNLVYDRKT